MSHPAYTFLCAALIGLVTAAGGDRTPSARAWLGAKTFFSCVAAVVAGSWVMFAIHG